MEFDYFRHNEGSLVNNNRQSLLSSGWRPLQREFDWEFLGQLMFHDTQELTQKSLNLASSIAETLGRNNYTWWANVLNIVSENTRYEVEKYWNYITPDPLTPDYRYQNVLNTDTPITQFVNRNSIPIDYILNRLQEITVMRVLKLLENPDIITQYYLERNFYFPVDKFVSWERLDIINTVYAYWSKDDVWLQIDPYDRGRRHYSLMAKTYLH